MIVTSLTTGLASAAKKAFVFVAQSHYFPFAGFVYRAHPYMVIGEKVGHTWVLRVRALFPSYTHGGAVFMPQTYAPISLSETDIDILREVYEHE